MINLSEHEYKIPIVGRRAILTLKLRWSEVLSSPLSAARLAGTLQNQDMALCMDQT